MENIELRDNLITLIKAGKDDEAAQLLRTAFSQRPLISVEGNDSELDFVVNPVGFGELYAKGEWDRTVRWYDAVSEIINDYEVANNVTLHKGLVLHNKGLPLIKLNRLDEAANSIEGAYSEDKTNFSEEAETRPAYLVLCFLKPIVDRGHWNKELLSGVGTELIFNVFEELYKTLQGQKLHMQSEKSINDKIIDEELKRVLLRRYKIVKDTSVDPLMRIIYGGSILEGVLGNILTQSSEKALIAFAKIAREDKKFLFFIELPEDAFEKILNVKTKKKEIKRWDLLQMISVAKELELYSEEKIAAFYILGNLLRDYRNLVHPSNLEAIGKIQGSTIIFDVNENIANMIATVLDVVLTFIANEDDSLTDFDAQSMVMDSGQHSPPPQEIITPSGIYLRSPLTSLASPSRVPFEDISEMPRVISYTDSRPSMGSTTTILLEDQQEHE